MRRRFALATTLLVVSALAGACSRKEVPASSTFYDRKIGPILASSCARSPTGSGCHVTADDRGNALGNLNVESYETLTLRRDLFDNYGPYGVPGLLLKVAPAYALRITTFDNKAILLQSNIVHAGGSLLDFSSNSFTQLQRWIGNGAAQNNARPLPPKLELSSCNAELGTGTGFDAGVDPAAADYGQFVLSVNDVIGERCAAGNCHGSPVNTLYLTCGTTAEQRRWNYHAMGDYVSGDPAESEILRRALSTDQGGTYHEGGVVFEVPTDPDYQALKSWALAKGGPSNVPANPGFAFFSERVQPMLARRGCMVIGCHSAAMFHDYRLRGGSGGHFGLAATRVNYQLSLDQIALDSTDPNASRLLRKNLVPQEGGMLHRGGPLFAYGGDPTQCDLAAAETADLNTQNEYCVIVAWIEKERAERRATAAPLSGVVFVQRPPSNAADHAQDFAEFAPGAALVLASVSVDAAGVVTASSQQSLLASCGLSAGVVDVRRPAVSWDGKRIAFSSRGAVDQPWRVYVIDGTNCALEPTIDAAPVDDAGAAVPTNGELVHNFDPAFAPDGRIVFTSTRGNVMNTALFSYQGPQRTPADPSKPNANLYVAEDGKVRQLTFLLNQELLPSFMNDGRLIFTTEKRAPGFYQLAARRQNLDGGDYHPLFGQRATLGFEQVTDVVELSDKNFAAIVSQRGAAHGAGALLLMNRSLGVDHRSTTPGDYLVDPGAIDYPNPKFFQHSTTIVDPAATGRLDATSGAYRNPSPLPDAKLVVSYAANVQNLAAFSGKFDLYVVDTLTGQRSPLLQDATADLLWPVGVYARYAPNGVFSSRIGEPNGATRVYTDERKVRSEITYLDLPLLSSLMFQNTRTGRPFADAAQPSLWESLPPEPGVKSYADGGSYVVSDAFGQVYARRRHMGSVAVQADGSAKVAIVGGMPVLFSLITKLSGDSAAKPHFQREDLQFYPGEFVAQGFRRDLFEGVCGGCHGSLSGLEQAIAVNPDILTSASSVTARALGPTDLTHTGGNVSAPPFD